jgi:hypothetical protein
MIFKILIGGVKKYQLEETRPMFAIFDRAIKRNDPEMVLIASGTSLGLKSVNEVMGSDTLKADTVVHSIVNLPYFDELVVRKFLGYWLDLNQVEPDLLTQLCRDLAGRGRIAGTFLISVITSPQSPRLDVNEFLKRCWDRFVTQICCMPSPEGSYTTLYSLVARWHDHSKYKLAETYLISAILSGNKIIFEIDEDLSPTDLYWAIDIENRQWEVGEPLLLRAAFEYYVKHDKIVGEMLRHFATQMQYFSPKSSSKGHLLEGLLAAHLLEKHGNSLSTLPSMKEFLSKKNNLIDEELMKLLNSLTFNFSSVVRQALTDDFVSFCNKKDNTTLLYPSPLLGPDLVGFLSPNVMLVCACRFHDKKIPANSIQLNVRSTDLFFCYYCTDGSRPNPNCCRIRPKVLRFLRSADIKVMIRLVLSLPEARGKPPQPLRVVPIALPRGNKEIPSIVLHITKTNLDQLFSGKALIFLQKLMRKFETRGGIN